MCGARYACRPSARPTTPSTTHVAPRYLADTRQGDERVPNVVTSVLADYRGYDTLGETTVIFTAGHRRHAPAAAACGGAVEARTRGSAAMNLDLILRIGTKLILPFILLFALYVQFHGDFGPGGGFQAGVITAGMVILYAIIFGLTAAKRIAPQALVERMIPLGVLIYAGTGVAGLLLGQATISTTPSSPTIRRTATSSASSLVELGVLITVSGTMTALFYAFVERGR